MKEQKLITITRSLIKDKTKVTEYPTVFEMTKNGWIITKVSTSVFDGGKIAVTILFERDHAQ